MKGLLNSSVSLETWVTGTKTAWICPVDEKTAFIPFRQFVFVLNVDADCCIYRPHGMWPITYYDVFIFCCSPSIFFSAPLSVGSASAHILKLDWIRKADVAQIKIIFSWDVFGGIADGMLIPVKGPILYSYTLYYTRQFEQPCMINYPEDSIDVKKTASCKNAVF